MNQLEQSTKMNNNLAIDDIKLLKRSEPSAFKKAQKLLLELMEHPRTGIGKPEIKK